MAYKEERKTMEEGMAEEAAIRAAEEELLEKFRRERRLGREGGGSATSSQADSESEAERKKRGGTSPTGEEGRRKRGRLDSVEGEGEDDGVGGLRHSDDPLKRMEGVVRMMAEWWRQPTIMKMVTKPQTQRFEKYMCEAKEALVLAREKVARLEARVEERGALVDIVRSTVREELKSREEAVVARRPVSYAEAAGKKDIPKISGVKGPVQPVPKLVVIRQENVDGDEVKKRLKELVKPSELGLKVKRLTKIRNGVILEAESDEGVENLIKNEALQKAGIRVGKPTKKSPIVMVYDVNSTLKDEEVKEEVFGRNMLESGIPEEEFRKEFVVMHRYKEKAGARNEGKRNHLVVECSVRVRNWLRRKGRIFIEWESCRIKDFVDVARCYKCQRFGHVAKFCTSQKPSCSHCAGEHEFRDCQKKKGSEKCVNCVRENRPETKHACSWRGCPAYERAVKRYSEQIDYGL